MADQEAPRRRRIDIPTLVEEKRAFSERIIGQDEAVDAFALLIAKLRSPIKPNEPGPRDIKFLAGPSGVGKTEIVETFAEILAGSPEGRDKVIKIDGGDYQERHALSRIIGSPPGYIGSEDPRYPGSGADLEFSQANLDAHRISYIDSLGNERSVVVILVDEAEKAHEALHKGFLAVLDKGKMKLANNKIVDFSDAVIFYTSNVGNKEAEVARDRLRNDGATEEEIQIEAKKVMKEGFKAAFPPEFQGRITEPIYFKNLSKEALLKIISLRKEAVKRTFAESGVHLDLDLSQTALDWLIEQGYNPTEGARALKKVINSSILDSLLLAHGGLGGTGLDGKIVHVDKEDGEPGLSFYFNKDEVVEQAQKPKSVTKKVVFSAPGESAAQPVGEREMRPDGTYTVRYPAAQIPPDEVDRYHAEVVAERKRVEEFQRSPAYADLQRRQQAAQDRKVQPIPSTRPNPAALKRPSEPRPNQAVPQRPAQESAEAKAIARARREHPEIPIIPEPIKDDLIKVLSDRILGINLAGYIHRRDEYVREGVITAAQANAQPEIKLAIAQNLVRILRGGVGSANIAGYKHARDEADRAGIILAATANGMRAIKATATHDLQTAYRRSLSGPNVSGYRSRRDEYIRAGIGTVEEWDKLIFGT